MITNIYFFVFILILFFGIAAVVIYFYLNDVDKSKKENDIVKFN
jgi:hypothetical protein